VLKIKSTIQTSEGRRQSVGGGWAVGVSDELSMCIHVPIPIDGATAEFKEGFSPFHIEARVGRRFISTYFRNGVEACLPFDC